MTERSPTARVSFSLAGSGLAASDPAASTPAGSEIEVVRP